MPLPYILEPAGAPAAGGGSCVVCLSGTVGLAEDEGFAAGCPPGLATGNELPRTRRCLSSASSSLSSPSVSNASASAGSTLACLSLDDIDEVREWKDGGGELGIGCVGRGPAVTGVSGSSSSWAFTCQGRC